MTKSYLGITTEDLERKGGIHTAKEITSQPSLWLKVYDSIKTKKTKLNFFLIKFRTTIVI